MLGAVAAEVGQRGEVHQLGNLAEGQALIGEIIFYDGYGVAVDVAADAVPRHPFDCG